MSATLNELTNNPAERIKSMLSSLRGSPKLLLVICGAAALSVIIALMFWAKEPDYRVLFSNISDEEGGAIVAQLSQLNVPYRIDTPGGVIMVPASQVHEVRMKLAQQGLPKGGGVGFELLDQEKFGVSQFTEQVNYQRALEGELARTIENLGPIQSARVHLATPKPSMFVREQKKPTASVTVNLLQGRTLDDSQVVAITHLISSAVTGLAAESVTIVDQRGNLLTQSGLRGLQTAHLKYTNEIESDYQQRIQRILAPLVGDENIRAQVTAQIDFTEQEQTQEQYQPNSDPEKMAIRSRQASLAEQGNRRGASGVPGALSNTPPAPATAPITQPLNTPVDDKKEKTTGNNASRETAQPYNNRSDETTNFEVDRTLTHTKSSVGRIQRLSVAVVINHLPQGEEGKPGPISEAELTRINALVKEAIGYNASRGDSVNILNSAFNGVVEEPVPPFWEQDRFYALLMAIARYLVIAIIAWVMWRKLVQPAWVRHQETTLRRLEMEKEAREEEIAAKKRAAEKSNRDRAQQRVDTELNGQQLRELAEQEPRVIALVIRQWMSKEPK
ncbi:TPA: flagellar M-ring protein FliF [Enterobacter cloacae subsp. dissolvens]|uniref:flagellar basal-body MS-ring/collar protein FliF n=1 Tax=Enterobacter cloacae complex TaxID=354276 RepID=UPI000681F8BE|nr:MULTISPECIES: flagellar basal-body MS-ring/collar protein FliF [Enterobacter cloacae complex]MCE1969901.1 flagellar M-ring protein FliF [Enterobacter cloacae]MCK7414596.1 flagellar M-ring protein FliF [Enterobacter cloacae]MCK7436983.1 flagellar M-ring protein FliF [Enterobacter cloacae]MCR6730588.1 flagellar M-ring protein FliF [Enterobacter cloacae]MRM11433.1 flagellar basal body M-ring protein FliF [Enterobacter cloacae subsp. dissolvens]